LMDRLRLGARLASRIERSHPLGPIHESSLVTSFDLPLAVEDSWLLRVTHAAGCAPGWR
jgi:hypothetical protein